ncbi:MAG: hypothetical protein K8I03_02905 [Ignavibacteria bacterium]|nr:hypothetical protein [Ignavibacteria bacterium]
MLAAIYQNEVNNWNQMITFQTMESDVEFEEDETTSAQDDKSRITPVLEDDIFRIQKNAEDLREFF